VGRVITIGSGDGASGKSFLAVNLGVVLAQRHLRVCLVDLNLRTAELHLPLGVRCPKRGLLDFISGRMSHLEEISVAVEGISGLRLVPGTGETLRPSSLKADEVAQLVHGLNSLPADVVLVEVGESASRQNLDLYLAGDRQIVVMDLHSETYAKSTEHWLRLARGRRTARGSAVTTVPRQAQIYTSLEDLVKDMTAIRDAEQGCASPVGVFHPVLVLNSVQPGSHKKNLAMVEKLRRELGDDVDLPVWAEIPNDSAVLAAEDSFEPLVISDPGASAAKAISDLATRVMTDLGAESLEDSLPASLETSLSPDYS